MRGLPRQSRGRGEFDSPQHAPRPAAPHEGPPRLRLLRTVAPATHRTAARLHRRAIANASTVALMPASSSLGTSLGASAMKASRPQPAAITPDAPPSRASTRFSTKSCANSRFRWAPSAARTASSWVRAAPRAKRTFATFTHVIKRTTRQRRSTRSNRVARGQPADPATEQSIRRRSDSSPGTLERVAQRRRATRNWQHLRLRQA